MASNVERAGAIVEAALNRPVPAALKQRLAAAFGWRLPPEATMEDKAGALVDTVVKALRARLDQYESQEAVDQAAADVIAQNDVDMAPAP